MPFPLNAHQQSIAHSLGFSSVVFYSDDEFRLNVSELSIQISYAGEGIFLTVGRFTSLEEAQAALAWLELLR